MQSIIENYKGFEIRFDTDRETFLCDIDYERSIKKSYAAIKKFISDWSKENQNFNKFKIESTPKGREKERLTVIGKHGNGSLTVLDSDGKSKQLSKYDFDDYMLVDEANKTYWDELNELSKRRDDLNTVEKNIKSKFTVKTVKEYIKEQAY